MSNSLLKRLATVKAKRGSGQITILNPCNPDIGFDDSSWPAEYSRRLAAAETRGDQVFEIVRSYGRPGECFDDSAWAARQLAAAKARGERVIDIVRSYGRPLA
jgi:hypothetical protein